MSLKQSLVEEAAKAVPAGTTLTLTLFGVPITQWAAVLSILVLLVQLFYLIRNNMGGRNGKRDSQRGGRRYARSYGPDGRVDAD